MPKVKRSTALKKAMLDLFATQHLWSAAQLVAALHQQGFRANKTSIYRNLQSFLEDRLICQQSFGMDEFVYELQHDHHDHLACQKCGKVTEIPCVIPEATVPLRYQVDHHHVTLFGVCGQCGSA